jgi:hypothetical protein
MEMPLEGGINHWMHSVDRLVNPANREVTQEWRNNVVSLAASGQKQQAFEQVLDKLIEFQDPYSLGVENGRADEWLKTSREPGIIAWLDQQVKADEANHALHQSAAAALGANPPLTHATAPSATPAAQSAQATHPTRDQLGRTQ